MKFIRNVLWSFGGTIGVQLIGLITNVILARQLTPEIFGIVSLALTLIVFVHIIQEAGLSSVIVQKKTISKSLIATTFFLNISLSLILSALLFIFAPRVALFYGFPEIEGLLYFSIIGIIIGSFGVTFRGILMRNRQFKSITIINLISELLGVFLTFIFLFYGEYILAVGIRIIARPAFQAIFLSLKCNFSEIKGKPQMKLLKEILPFSSSILGVQSINYLKNNIDYLLIGKLLGIQSLGLYTIAFQWSTIAKFYISGSVAKVLFPEISRNQHDLESIKHLFINAISQVSFIIFPFCIGLVLIAPEFIYVIYGQRWGEAVPILQILMVAGLLTSIGTIVGKVFQGLGRPGIELKITVVSIVAFIPFILLGAYFGLIGVAVAVLIHSAIFDTLLIVKVLRLLSIPVTYFISSLKPIFYSMLFVIVFYSLLKYMFFNNNFSLTSLIVLMLIQIILYIFATYLFNKTLISSLHKKIKSLFKLKIV